MLMPYEHEEIFFEDIKKFKSLVERFSRNEANEYSNYKRYIHSNGLVKAFSKLGSKPIYYASTKSSFKIPKVKNSSSSSIKKVKKEAKLSASTYKTKKPVNLQVQEEEESSMKKTKLRKVPEFLFLSLIAFSLIFSLFIGVEVAIIVTNDSFFKVFSAGHLSASNFMWRLPKLGETMLYMYASSIYNDPEFIRVGRDEFKDSVYCNYFKVNPKIEDNSFYVAYGDSNFAYLNYQLSIIRENINKFSVKKSIGKSLKGTVKYNEIYQEDLCVQANSLYYSTLNTPMDYKYVFEQMSLYITRCRAIGNGINLGGLNQSINLIVQQLNNVYMNFVKSEDPNRSLAMIQNQSFVISVRNNNRIYGRLNSVYGRTILIDILDFTNQDKHLKIMLSIFSIFLSCFVILGLLWLILMKLDQHNKYVKSMIYILNNFDKDIDL